MSEVRDIATVRVTDPVRGMRRGRGKGRSPQAVTTRSVRVLPEVMAAAKAAMKPGQRLVIVSATEVRIVNQKENDR